MDSINQTKKLIIIEETWSGSGIISEVSTELEELVRNGIKINMIGGRGDIGASLFSETESLISESKIISEISRFLEEENA
jgi:pyruvate/2-oxoglutarate/acetoin dehydrogenase E1 component